MNPNCFRLNLESKRVKSRIAAILTQYDKMKMMIIEWLKKEIETEKIIQIN